MTETKFGNPNIQKKVIQLLQKTDMPASIDFVAYHLHIGWGTARAILLNLAMQNRIIMQKTTKSFIFSALEEGAKDGSED